MLALEHIVREFAAETTLGSDHWNNAERHSGTMLFKGEYAEPDLLQDELWFFLVANKGWLMSQSYNSRESKCLV